MMHGASFGVWVGSHVNVSASASEAASSEPSGEGAGEASDEASDASSSAALDGALAKMSPPSSELSSPELPLVLAAFCEEPPPHRQIAAAKRARITMRRQAPKDPSPPRCTPNMRSLPWPKTGRRKRKTGMAWWPALAYRASANPGCLESTLPQAGSPAHSRASGSKKAPAKRRKVRGGMAFT